MGAKRDNPGVEIRGNALRVYFQYKAKLHRETLDLPPTPPNIKHAVRLVAEIKGKIRAGNFNYAEYFPNSKHAINSNLLFAEKARIWLKTLTLAKSTIQGYRKILNTVWMPHLAGVVFKEIKFSTLKTILVECRFKSAKTYNNALTPIKGVFNLAFVDGDITVNPADRLQPIKHQKEPPDPCELHEVDLILAWLEKNRPEPIWNYYEYAFFSGIRPSEQISIEWGDIDFVHERARIQRAKVLSEIKSTKTYRIRDIELNSRALAALKRQKKWTYLNGKEVFLDPITDKPFVNDKPPRLHWDAALKATGLRHRVAYQTRHTFATLNLMSGANPMWVAQQLGHTSMKMVLEVYSKWIPGADKSAEKRKIEKALNGKGFGKSMGKKG